MRAPAVCAACGHDLLLHLYRGIEGEPCRALVYAMYPGAAVIGICGCPQFHRSQVIV